MQNYRHTILSRDFMNLTDERICLYEESSGRIIAFDPIHCVLPPFSEVYAFEQPPQYYIVDEAKLDEIRNSGRPLEDVAVLKSKSYGRHGAPIGYLVWARNPDIRIKLHEYDERRSCECTECAC